MQQRASHDRAERPLIAVSTEARVRWPRRRAEGGRVSEASLINERQTELIGSPLLFNTTVPTQRVARLLRMWIYGWGRYGNSIEAAADF